MDTLLLIFFALPVATIILSVVLETLIHSPVKIAAIFFSIYLVVAFALGDETLLIAVIAYTILSFVSAYVTRLILQRRENTCHYAYPAVQNQSSFDYTNSLSASENDDFSTRTNTCYPSEKERYPEYYRQSIRRKERQKMQNW